MRSGVRIPVGKKDFSLLQNSRTVCGVHPGYRGSFLGGGGEVERTEREVEHSSLFRAKVKNEWIYSSFPATCLYGVDREIYVL